MRPRRPIATLVALATTAAITAAAGCSSGGDDSGRQTTTTAKGATSVVESTSTTEDGGDEGDGTNGNASRRCPTDEAVAEVVGGAVDRGAHGGSQSSVRSDEATFTASYEGCSWRVTEGPDGRVSISRYVSSEVDGKPGPTGTELFDRLAERASDKPDFTELTVGEHSAFDNGEDLVVDTGDAPLRITTSGDDLGPDQATLRIQLAELALAED